MTTDPMDARAVLSALMDRERVDPEELARVLEDQDARRLLVDFVRLRLAIAADADDEAHAVPAPAVVTRRPARTRGWMRLAASLLLMAGSLGGGLWLGKRLDHERPPTPTRIVEFKTGVDWRPRP